MKHLALISVRFSLGKQVGLGRRSISTFTSRAVAGVTGSYTLAMTNNITQEEMKYALLWYCWENLVEKE